MHTTRFLTGGGAAVHNRKWHHNTPYHHWQTDACEDIALSQISFAGGKTLLLWVFVWDSSLNICAERTGKSTNLSQAKKGE